MADEDPRDDVEAAGARAAKNTAVRAAGEIIGKVGSFVLFAVLARETGPVGVGIYVFALSWGEVAMTPVGLGIDRYMLRRVGECRKKVMSLYRLLGNKADVIKGFAKRCNEHWDIAPRNEIGMYLGDIQDHIVTMTGNLSHYEKYVPLPHILSTPPPLTTHV